MEPMAVRHPVSRYAQLSAGILLMLAAPVVAPLPGPAGTLAFAGGLVLVLRNSHAARVRFARIKRRWPRAGRLADTAMRRRSALRRRARDRAAAAR
jgi:hypothetical protein